ncbi:TonB-dependent receptor [Sorangium sp. So ce321]|uniref:TonB-dependent receptor n=1 Tax=Sorangium sp. So ce321 TaxID=3133300 RepID=UPI003F6375BD
MRRRKGTGSNEYPSSQSWPRTPLIFTIPALAVWLWPARSRADDYDRCLRTAKTQAEIDACAPPDRPIEVRVRAKPPARSASDVEVDAQVIAAAPHGSGADVLNVAPGVFVSDRGLPGRAPHLSLRGFDGTSGQDVEIFAGNIPMNQVSHIRAPGYADMRLIMPEVIRSVRIASGPYDPKQGDFGVAGSLRMELGLEEPGFWLKGGVGSFGTRRVFLAFAPEHDEMQDTFAAFETDATDGPGGARGGERSSFVGQLGGGNEQVDFRATVAIGSARFDFPGYLPQALVERGGDPYAARRPLGRDRTSQALIGAEVVWSPSDGILGIGAFAGKTRTTFHQNLTGFALDQLAGERVVESDDSEMVNDAWTVGLTVFYRHGVEITSKRDSIEMGLYSRVDSVDQTDTRLFEDGTRNATLIDATVDATNVAAYADLALYPIRRVVVRGGARLDSLSYSVQDRTSNAGLERTAQGFVVSSKVMADVAVKGGVHVVASYGEGFRSPQARDLGEGERVPFTRVRGVEAGVRLKDGRSFQGSAVGFGSWLGNDRVFDATSRQSVEAPPSARAGAQLVMSARSGPFGAHLSGTYTHARFTGSDERFREGDAVPYAPAFVLRDDVFASGAVGELLGKEVTVRVGAGVEGAAGRSLPGGRAGKDSVSLDAVAAVGWRGMELALNGTNLLGQRYNDAQYVYVSNFEERLPPPPPSPHVLVAAPTALMLTFQVHVHGKKREQESYY